MKRQPGAQQRVLDLLNQEPPVTWTVNMLHHATGLTARSITVALSQLAEKGRAHRVGRGAYIGTEHPIPDPQPTDEPAPRKSNPGTPGPCPQSDALLRLMRGNGRRTARAWAALWCERDSVTLAMLEKLRAAGLAYTMNGEWRA